MGGAGEAAHLFSTVSHQWPPAEQLVYGFLTMGVEGGMRRANSTFK